ncbi:MAG TPA: EAL domain-containing protein [Kineosporiaceae bacterium]|nr:EAL domain-containing protein [Kineosporiaceae bacterium]
MALLQGTGGTRGKRSRVDRPLVADPDPETGDPIGAGQCAELRVDRELSINRLQEPDAGLGDSGMSAPSPPAAGKDAAVLEATLLRLAAAGPTLADVLAVLAREAAALLEAPARIALAVQDRLVWTAASDDCDTPIGTDADVEGTACGAAWRTGLIQNVTRPAPPTATVISLDRPEAGTRAKAVPLTTDCCGSAEVVLAVPLLREGPAVQGRHAGFSREVFAVLALIGQRPNWFDDDDIEATADLAEVAGERVAALALIGEQAEPVDTFSAFAAPPDQVDDLGSAPDPTPEQPQVRVRTAHFDWHPFLTPSAGEMPPATTSITVVPAAKPGRSGFGGWFTRTPKRPLTPAIPGPRAASRPDPTASVETDSVTAESAAPAAAPEKPMPAISESTTSGPTTSSSERASAVPTPSRPAVAPSVAPFERLPQPQRVRSETALRRAVPVEQLPGSGPMSRLPRARIRTTGTPMPQAMPAPDTMGLWQWDAISGKCTWSSPVARLLGLPPDAELGLDQVRAAVAPADRGRFDVAVTAIGTGRGVAGALRLKTSDGRAKHAYAWSEVRRDESGKVLGAWGGVVDVTAFEHDAAALRSGLAGLRAAQELTGLATWEWRADAKQLLWSDEMYRLAGVPAETFEPTPERWHAFVHPDDLERARRLDLDAGLDSGPGTDGERVETFRLIGPGGEIRHVQSWSATSGDRVVYGATIDVTRQVHDRMALERLSATDPVTGLGNRLAFDRRMQQLLVGANGVPGRPVRPAPSVTLLLLDLDRFKVVNDSLGHQVGDRLLIEVARRLVAVVPNGSVTARMGGDEFVVVPPAGADELEVRRLASGIVEAMRAPYLLPETGELLICPASLGVAMSDGRRVTGNDLLREADIALYRAKDSGRDRYMIFDAALKARTRTRQQAERRLRTALEEDRLVMQYQPVVDFSNGRVIGAEGLVRLFDSDGGSDSPDRLIAPDLFLDVAEQTGLVVEIDCWVIETAIQQLAQWSESGTDAGPWLAINLSARSMEHPRVVHRLIEAVKRGEVSRDQIKIELTERSFIGSLPGVDAGVRKLIANGIGVGIDDFGTGYSALAYLQHFDLDFMKIDRAFVSSVGEGPRGDAVVTAIVDLAHAHGMRVIAEGVESGRQARRLREIGCDFAQGFHFGRPGDADRIVRG